VKPRKIPSVSLQDDDAFQAIVVDNQLAPSNSQVPHVTHVHVMQAIGINLCGVPLEELSPKKVMASL
jgi:hypothetical protein